MLEILQRKNESMALFRYKEESGIDLVYDRWIGEGEGQIGHAGQLAVHQDLTGHIAANHQTVGVYRAVNIFHNVQINFVVGVFYTLLAPPDAAHHKTW
jgi:hypothetical protein